MRKNSVISLTEGNNFGIKSSPLHRFCSAGNLVGDVSFVRRKKTWTDELGCRWAHLDAAIHLSESRQIVQLPANQCGYPVSRFYIRLNWSTSVNKCRLVVTNPGLDQSILQSSIRSELHSL